ncbi:Fmu (Sun) domain protein [Pyrolobus fumarii 1A]|uniref:Fmu (Sun) domain protein n=1 Tax=Pyrolobus fumarii (strain DSM 11204 / 1A) TaxID=694429 RepID=G0ECM5_PYRF1|nr:RsmB/NOP family class I SAM-dependent RNA methyltransferase [Pyrolobus fumarii]AEM39595.1 Fmu (Sun) domain protein [Pyrolobus fumarii 1A]
MLFAIASRLYLLAKTSQAGWCGVVDVELVCGAILAIVERSFRSLRAVLESGKWDAPRGLLHALCLGVLRNYKLLVRALRRCGFRGQVRGGRREGWVPIVAAYEAMFRREAVPRERLEKFLPRNVVECLLRLEPRDVVLGVSDPLERLSLLYSIPRWVVERLSRLLPRDRLESVLRAFQEPPPTYIRFNRLVFNDVEAVVEDLKSRGVYAKPDPVLDDVVVVEYMEPGAVGRLPGNLYYIQDRSAALIAHVLGQVEGVVLDSFSAPGGKAGHVAWRNPRVSIVAVDLSRRRLRDEARLLARQGVDRRVVLVEGDARRPPVRRVDAAIVDPDCSSIGRLGHSPETRLFLEQAGPRIIERLSRLQYEGLKAAALTVKKGGVIVYSTCTLTLEENEGVVKRLLDEGLVELVEAAPWVGERSPVLPETQRVYPDVARCGGGYTAKLVRV